MADRNQIYRDMAPYINYDISGWGDLLEQFPAEKVKKGTVIYMQHSRGHNVVLVEKGVATMSFINTEGVERIHFFGSSGYVFGFRHCMSGKPYGGTMTALTDLVIHRIPRQAVKEKMQADSRFFQFMMTGEYERGIVYSRKRETLALPTCSARVAILLLSLASCAGKADAHGCVIPFRLTHDTISKVVYSDRVTVSRVISSMEKDGSISKKGGYIQVCDREKLREHIIK